MRLSEFREFASRLFEAKKRCLGVEAELRWEWGTPLPEGVPVPFSFAGVENGRPYVLIRQNPSRLDAFSVEEAVCHELVHIKHPTLEHYTPEFGEKVRNCLCKCRVR